MSARCAIDGPSCALYAVFGIFPKSRYRQTCWVNSIQCRYLLGLRWVLRASLSFPQPIENTSGNCPASTNTLSFYIVNNIRSIALTFGNEKLFTAYLEVVERVPMSRLQSQTPAFRISIIGAFLDRLSSQWKERCCTVRNNDSRYICLRLLTLLLLIFSGRAGPCPRQHGRDGVGDGLWCRSILCE